MKEGEARHICKKDMYGPAEKPGIRNKMVKFKTIEETFTSERKEKMKNHEHIRNVNDFISSGIYRINPNKFLEYFEGERLDHCRSWTFRPVFASGKVILIDTYAGYKGVEVADEMLKKDVIEFVCDSADYVDLGTDPERVEDFKRDDYEIVRLDSGEPHYLLRRGAKEDREIKLKNLIGKRNSLLWELKCVENKILTTAMDGEEVYYPAEDMAMHVFDKSFIEKHENEFREAFKHNLGSLNFDEWLDLEEFLEMPLTYEQYEAVADYCNNDAEIDGNILDIAAFEDRKSDLLTVARNAERENR